MAAIEDVTLTVSVNGGPPQQGGVTCALGATIQLSAVSKAGWGENGPVRWEILTAHAWSLPAGWADAGGGVFYCLGMDDPPPFNVTPWGKYATRVVVGQSVADERTMVSVLSSNGMEAIAIREGTQFHGSVRTWIGSHDASLRALESAAGFNPQATPTLNIATTGAAGTTNLGTRAGEAVNVGPSTTRLALGTGAASLAAQTGGIALSSAVTPATAAANTIKIKADTAVTIDAPLLTWDSGRRIVAYWPVKAIATSNVNLSAPGTTVDGATMVAGDLFVPVAQVTAAQRGVYVWNGAAVAATRHASLGATPAAGDVGLTVRAVAGVNAGKAYMLTNASSPQVWDDVTGGGGGGGDNISNGPALWQLDGSGNLTTSGTLTATIAASDNVWIYGEYPNGVAIGNQSNGSPASVAGTGVDLYSLIDLSIRADGVITLRAGSLDPLQIYDDGDYAIEAPTGVGMALVTDAGLGLNGGTSVTERVGSSSRAVTVSGSSRIETTADNTGSSAKVSTSTAAATVDEYIGSHELRIAARTSDTAPPTTTRKGGNAWTGGSGANTNKTGGNVDTIVGYGRTGGTDADGSMRFGLGRLVSPNGSGTFSLYADGGAGAFEYEGIRLRIDPGGNSYFYNPNANASLLAAINAYVTAFAGIVEINGFTGVKITGNIAFFGGTPAAKPTVTGSRGGNAALASLLTGLASLGLITDSSSA